MRRNWIWTAVLLAGLAAGSYGLYLYLLPAPLPGQLVYGSGHVEGTEIAVPAEVAGLIVENRMVEGERVGEGDLLVRLDEADFRLQRQRAAAEVEALRAERERAASETGVWRHHLATAERDLERYRTLRERNTIPPQRLEQAENVFEEAKGRLASLEAEISALDRRIEAALEEQKLVERRIAKTSIEAPIDGTVLVKAREEGEFVQTGQTVAVLVDLSRVELKVFIPEKDIGKVGLGDPARLRVDAFPNRLFEATIARVDQRAQFTPRDIHLPEERVRMVFGVTLAVDNPDGVLKPGMPADAWILWQQDAGWPEWLFVPR